MHGDPLVRRGAHRARRLLARVVLRAPRHRDAAALDDDALDDDAALNNEEQLGLLRVAARANRFVGEPLVLEAQVHYAAGRYPLALEATSEALRRMYALGTAWDKRRSYASWLAFARMLHVRAARMARGRSALPYDQTLPKTSGGLPLVAIQDVHAEMP